MMRRLVLAFALVASFALDASVVEAATTSEKEGRKYSRKYVNQDVRSHRIPDAGWRQRDCYRIGRQGAGDYKILPGGVLCGFTGIQRGSLCVEYGVAVKDGKRVMQASNVDFVGAYRGDPADCEPNATTFEWSAQWYGVVGGPLRPFA
jgi:hypothetical protein